MALTEQEVRNAGKTAVVHQDVIGGNFWSQGEAPAQKVKKATVTVVVPAMNEGRNIEWVLKKMPSCVDEVVLVDGNSEDDTVERARAQCPDLVLVSQSRPGKGVALREGFEASTGDIVVMIDADGSMDPAEIPAYVAPLAEEQCDLVKGSRRLPGGGSEDITFIRDLGNRALLGLANGLFGSRFSELCYGFMAFRRSCLPDLRLDADGFEIETQMVVHAVKADLRVAEVPSMESPRRNGESNLHAVRDGFRILGAMIAALKPWKDAGEAAPAFSVVPGGASEAASTA